MISFQVSIQIALKEILQSDKVTLTNQVDVFVLAEKYQWLDEVLPVAVERLYQNSLSVLKRLDGYQDIKRNGVIFEKRLGMIERGRNYKHFCFFKQRYNELVILHEILLSKLHYCQAVWSDDEYRCTEEHWSLRDFRQSPAARCKLCMENITDEIEKCCTGMREDLSALLKKQETKTGE